MYDNHPIPSRPLILQIVGYKNTGKTTMVCRLIERFKKESRVVGTIKHDAHDFIMDTPGTDTWKHQTAGADITAISSSARTAILKKGSDTLEQLVAAMPEAEAILVEGFKQANYPKIAILRERADLALAPQLRSVAAFALWPDMYDSTQVRERLLEECPDVPHLHVDDVEGLYKLMSRTPAQN